MKKHGLLGIILIILITITGCSSTNTIQPRGSDDALKENWMSQVNTNPDNWIKNADTWFLTGESSLIQQNSKNAPIYTPLSPSVAAEFTNIRIAGSFQVQIVGGQEFNSVYVFAPDTKTSPVSFSIFKNNIDIFPAKKSTATMRNVIVRIGVRNLHSLTTLGNGLILGRTITSDKLTISSQAGASIFLGGNMNLTQVNQTGGGTITVIGAYSPKLNINVKGDGNVNINGRVGIENIMHMGDGSINIIGADSNALCITAAGKGLTTVFGYVNLKEVTAMDSSRVYVYWVYSNKAVVVEKGKANVGLAGSAGIINVDLSNTSCFQGEYLRGCSVYVRTKGNSHADIAADERIFASATDKSGIFYFGSPDILTPYTTQQGMLVSLGNYSKPSGALLPPDGPFQPPPFCSRPG